MFPATSTSWLHKLAFVLRDPGSTPPPVSLLNNDVAPDSLVVQSVVIDGVAAPVVGPGELRDIVAVVMKSGGVLVLFDCVACSDRGKALVSCGQWPSQHMPGNLLPADGTQGRMSARGVKRPWGPEDHSLPSGSPPSHPTTGLWLVRF